MLDPKDLEQIGLIVNSAINSAITNLVDTVLKPSFDEVFRRLDEHDVRLERLEQRLDRVESTMVTKYVFADRIAELRSEWDLKIGKQRPASAF